MKQVLQIMCKEIDGILKQQNELGQVVGGNYSNEKIEFNLNAPIIKLEQILVALMIRHPTVSWEIEQHRIISHRPNNVILGSVTPPRLPFTAPTPKY